MKQQQQHQERQRQQLKQQQRQWITRALLLLSLGGASSACGVLTQGTLGYVAPTSANQPDFTWSSVPGATAYQVVVALDRGLTAPVGTTGLIDGNRVDASAIAWQPGHPIASRTYFWAVRAYDRYDAGALLLSTGAATEVVFPAVPAGGAVTFGAPLPTPAAPSASAVPTATPAAAVTATPTAAVSTSPTPAPSASP